MQKKRILKIISVVLILVLICVSITYVKSGNKEVLATTREFNSESLQDNEHMYIETDNSGDKVPVPNGYVGSKATGENEIDTGYVIYEGEEEVNDSNVEEAQKTRNQYVWIPVPDASKMYGTDANGKKWGKLYEFTTETGDNINEKTGAKPFGWSEEDGIFINKSSNKEPTFVGDDININLKNYGLENRHEFLIQLEQEFNGMIESLEKYGGFYVGRYETGNIYNDKVVIVKYNNQINSQTWYNLYKKCKNLKSTNINIETGIIWGSQWDRILMWLVESGNKNKQEIIDSTTWGNYNNVTFSYKDSNGNTKNKNSGESIKILTGSSEYTKANNIYDLAGNIYELTMESIGGYNRIYRGGNYGYTTNTSVSIREKRDSPKWSVTRLPCNAIYKVNKRELIILKKMELLAIYFFYVLPYSYKRRKKN